MVPLLKYVCPCFNGNCLRIMIQYSSVVSYGLLSGSSDHFFGVPKERKGVASAAIEPVFKKFLRLFMVFVFVFALLAFQSLFYGQYSSGKPASFKSLKAVRIWLRIRPLPSVTGGWNSSVKTRGGI